MEIASEVVISRVHGSLRVAGIRFFQPCSNCLVNGFDRFVLYDTSYDRERYQPVDHRCQRSEIEAHKRSCLDKPGEQRTDRRDDATSLTLVTMWRSPSDRRGIL